MQTVSESNNYSIVDITNPEKNSNTLTNILNISEDNFTNTVNNNGGNDYNGVIFSRTMINIPNKYVIYNIKLQIDKSIIQQIKYYEFKDTGPINDPNTYIAADQYSNIDYIDFYVIYGGFVRLCLFAYDNNGNRVYGAKITGYIKAMMIA